MASAGTVMAVYSDREDTVLESRMRSKDSCPVWGEGAGKVPDGNSPTPYSTSRPVLGGRRGAIPLRYSTPEDLVGLAQFSHVTLQRSDALVLGRGRAGAPALIALSLANPAAQRLRRAADLGGNRADRGRLGGVLALVVEHHPDRTGTDLRRIRGYALGHGSILPGSGASGKPGTVHCIGAASRRLQPHLAGGGMEQGQDLGRAAADVLVRLLGRSPSWLP